MIWIDRKKKSMVVVHHLKIVFSKFYIKKWIKIKKTSFWKRQINLAPPFPEELLMAKNALKAVQTRK